MFKRFRIGLAGLAAAAVLVGGAVTLAPSPAKADLDVHLGIGLPYYYAPPPVYYAPPPVYYQPPPRVYYPPPRAYYYGPAPRPYYRDRNAGWHGGRDGGRHHRRDRWDD